MVGSGHTLVHVIRHSVRRVIWSDISAYIVGSNHTPVVYVIMHCQKTYVITHQRTNSGEWPFSHGVHKKVFSQNSYLIRRQNIHSV